MVQLSVNGPCSHFLLAAFFLGKTATLCDGAALRYVCVCCIALPKSSSLTMLYLSKMVRERGQESLNAAGYSDWPAWDRNRTISLSDVQWLIISHHGDRRPQMKAQDRAVGRESALALPFVGSGRSAGTEVCHVARQGCLDGEKKMITTFTKQLLSTTLTVLLLVGTTPFEVGAQSGQSGYSGQGVPLTADELQQLVAPIALYPDSLVAQILAAATFPDQVAAAASWLQQYSNLTGPTLMQAVDAQPWDPSVKALTQFPSVLGNLAANLTWTSSLGEAYHTQSAEVMASVQVLRAKALAAGNLKSGPQLAVVQQSPQVIVIQPVNPQVVYVPMYNPAVVYGYPYVVPAYVAPPPPAGAAVVAFGVGIAVGAMMASSSYAWGYSSWACGWHGTTAVVYHGGTYYGNSAWHGGYYGTSASAYGAYGSAHASTGYNPSTGTYARGATVSNGYGSASAGQAYNPRTGASASTVQGSNAYGSYGASTASKNGTTVDSQHQTNANGTTAQAHSSTGASAYGATGKNGNSAAVGQTANGDKYAAANGKTYSNTGSGWDQKSGTPSNYNKSSSSGWGGQEKTGGSSAMSSGGGGWSSRASSARGSASYGRR
jgi:hypothetical protein